MIIRYSFRRREKCFERGLPIGEEHYIDKPLRYQTLIPSPKKNESKEKRLCLNCKGMGRKGDAKNRTGNEQGFHVIV